MGAMQQEWDQIDDSVARLQDLMMRAKYSKKPVVTAPHDLTLGGGVEVMMHSAATVAAGETYAGLVEVGVGLVPAGGGCKELLVRYMGDIPEGVDYDPNPFVQKIFEYIGLAKVATSFWPTKPALPTPVTTTLPVQSAVLSAASTARAWLGPPA